MADRIKVKRLTNGNWVVTVYDQGRFVSASGAGDWRTALSVAAGTPRRTV